MSLLFRRTHKALGRNWSVTLEVRERHELVGFCRVCISNGSWSYAGNWVMTE